MKTCTGSVGLTWLNKLALGAPIGNPLTSISFLAYGCFGALIPTNPVWAVKIRGSSSRFAFKMIVSGPGQNCFVSN